MRFITLTTISVCVVRVWRVSDGAVELCIEWLVHLDGLIYLGDKVCLCRVILGKYIGLKGVISIFEPGFQKSVKYTAFVISNCQQKTFT